MSKFISFLNEKLKDITNPDDSKWITIFPGGKRSTEDGNQSKGIHILINKSGIVIGGMGDKYLGVSIEDMGDEKKLKSHEKTSAIFKRRIEKSAKGQKAHDASKTNHDLTTWPGIALGEYTGNFYEHINGFLRKTGHDEKYSGKINNVITQMNEAFKDASTTEDIQVYRALSGNFLNSIKIGDEIEDPAFTSTTTSEKILKGFKSHRQDEMTYIMKILVPKGSKAVSLTKVSKYEEEEEILLNKGTKFLVKNVSRDGNTLYLDVEANTQ